MKLGISLLFVENVIPQGFGPGNSGLGGPDIINFGLNDDGKARPPSGRPVKKPKRKPAKKNPNRGTNEKNTGNQYYKPTQKNPYAAAPVTTKPTTPKDVNECYMGTDKCHYNADCINTIGSYDCRCRNGFEGNGYKCTPKDVDECMIGNHKCDKYAKCTNTVGSYICTCNSGYVGNGYQCEIEKIDECANGSHNCSPYAYCLDKAWGFRCRCMDGWEGDGMICNKINQDPCANNKCGAYSMCVPGKYGGYTCQCDPGYYGNGMGANGCKDIDECYTGAHMCDDTAQCLNAPGTYNCACNEGYSGNGYSCVLDDVDECYMGTHKCADIAYCTNTHTGYDCHCPSGWVGDGMTCTNLASCEFYDPCKDGAVCIETNFGKKCICPAGYTGTPRMRTEDVSDDSRKRRDDGDDEEDRENRARPNKNAEKATSSYYGSSGSSHSGYHHPDPMSPGGVYGGVKGDGCVDIDECAGCGISGGYNPCPCSDPTPVCTNTPGSYTCGIDTAFGDPHFRVTAPGQEPVCFDLDTPSGSIVDLYSDAQTALEVNAQFKNVHNGKKQFIKTIGFTSNEGLQLAVTPTTVEIYENGKPFITYDLENDKVEERMFDIKIVIKPADHETRHNRHTVDIFQNDGQKFRFAVKPGAGSLAFDLEGIQGVASPTGIIGQFSNPGSYTTDAAGNIQAGAVHIPFAERTWHAENQCHQIRAEHVEAFLGHPVKDYMVQNMFQSLFYRGPGPAVLLDDGSEPK